MFYNKKKKKKEGGVIKWKKNKMKTDVKTLIMI